MYRKMGELHPRDESYVLTLLDEEQLGEKALVSNRELVWQSGKTGFFAENETALSEIARSGILEIAGHKVYAELLGHRKKLIVCGAGHVSIPIIRLGKMTGCHVTCIDDRPSFADHARDAGADHVICDPFMKALDTIEGDGDTYFVIVTRGHQWDQECLRVIAQKPHAYIGLMGSRRRVGIVKEKLEEEGIQREVLDTVHTPIGLDIGAETPEEIAVSVMAEIIKEKNKIKRNAGYPKEILDAIVGSALQGAPGKGRKVLATIVARKGSAPREVGTKMLILTDGRCIGTIGGGLAESKVAHKGLEMLSEENPKPLLFHVDLTDEAAADEGMVCGGRLDVLMDVIADQNKKNDADHQ